MNFSFEVILRNLPYLIAAAKWTLLISLAGMGISILLGILICAARISRSPWLSRASASTSASSAAFRFSYNC